MNEIQNFRQWLYFKKNNKSLNEKVTSLVPDTTYRPKTDFLLRIIQSTHKIIWQPYLRSYTNLAKSDLWRLLWLKTIEGWWWWMCSEREKANVKRVTRVCKHKNVVGYIRLWEYPDGNKQWYFGHDCMRTESLIFLNLANLCMVK